MNKGSTIGPRGMVLAAALAMVVIYGALVAWASAAHPCSEWRGAVCLEDIR